jgi:hypothetical protein
MRLIECAFVPRKLQASSGLQMLARSAFAGMIFMAPEQS